MKWMFHWGRASKWDPLNIGSLFMGFRGPESFKLVKPLEFDPTANGYIGVDTPTLDFQQSGIGDIKQFQQAMMDSLWAEGVRPSEGMPDLSAQERHLVDMQKIVGKIMGVDLGR